MSTTNQQTPNPCVNLKPEDQGSCYLHSVLGYVTYVLLGLSVVCSLITIITFTLFPRIRTYPIKLILFLCVTIVVGYGVFPFNPFFNPHGPDVCAVAGAIIHYCFLSNFFWCSNIAFNFYEMIVRRNPDTASFEKFYHFFGWGLPCLSVLGVSIAGHYGSTPPSRVCYIKSSLAIFLGFFLPGLILVSINAVLFFFVASEIHGTLRHAPNDKESKHKAKEFRVLMSIFVTVGLSWIFGFLTAVVDAFNVPVVSDIFLTLFSVSAPLQGVFIFIAYCLNKKVKNRWMNLFGKCFPCCKVDEGTQGTKTGGTASTRGGGFSSANNSQNSRSYASRT
jgi:hypothetical protein